MENVEDFFTDRLITVINQFGKTGEIGTREHIAI